MDGGSLIIPNEAGLVKDQVGCCQGKSILSCRQTLIDTSVLGDLHLYIQPLESTLTFQKTIGTNNNAYHYANKEVDLVLTHNTEMNTVHGHATLADGRSFIIEYCGDSIHALIELDIHSLGEDIGVYDVDVETSLELSNILESDDDTIVTYSVKIYYTEDFESQTADIDGYIDQVIAETNLGYMNSDVPVRITALCKEKATINDIEDSSEMLTAFKLMKGSYEELRDTADVAVLLVNDFSSCGIGYVNSVKNGHTISVSMKRCALGYYSFGHEIGHNFGLGHNIEETTNQYYPDGHGHLIAAGSESTGYRTILAYTAEGHKTRVNYYSNPEIIYPVTGTPTGISGVSNNARILTLNRFEMEAWGDESSSCSSF